MGHNDQSQIIESLDCEMIVATYVHVGVCICRCGAKIGNIHMCLAIGSEEPGDSANSCSWLQLTLEERGMQERSASS